MGAKYRLAVHGTSIRAAHAVATVRDVMLYCSSHNGIQCITLLQQSCTTSYTITATITAVYGSAVLSVSQANML